ncbi:hypothetical protein JL720_14901 [Aureococcus anophagefferens]|nr:hypothetical protein JL720_14901 [Aureococcus anophagefferens]
MAPTSPLTPGGYSVASSRSVWDPTNVLSSERVAGAAAERGGGDEPRVGVRGRARRRLRRRAARLRGGERALIAAARWEPRAARRVARRAAPGDGRLPRLGLGRDAVRCVGWQPAAAPRAGRPRSASTRRPDGGGGGGSWASSSDDSAKAVLFDLRSPLRLAHEAFVRFTVVEASAARPRRGLLPAEPATRAAPSATRRRFHRRPTRRSRPSAGPRARRFLDDSAESLARKIAALRVGAPGRELFRRLGARAASSSRRRRDRGASSSSAADDSSSGAARGGPRLSKLAASKSLRRKRDCARGAEARRRRGRVERRARAAAARGEAEPGGAAENAALAGAAAEAPERHAELPDREADLRRRVDALSWPREPEAAPDDDDDGGAARRSGSPVFSAAGPAVVEAARRAAGRRRARRRRGAEPPRERVRELATKFDAVAAKFLERPRRPGPALSGDGAAPPRTPDRLAAAVAVALESDLDDPETRLTRLLLKTALKAKMKQRSEKRELKMVEFRERPQGEGTSGKSSEVRGGVGGQSSLYDIGRLIRSLIRGLIRGLIRADRGRILRQACYPIAILRRSSRESFGPPDRKHRAMSWREKKLEYENRMARSKGKKLDTLKTCTICGADKAKACLGCGTTAYCSTDCQRIDWRDRGHRKVCKKIQAAEAARARPRRPAVAAAGRILPAPRSDAGVISALAAEHEAARVRREANPEPEPASARYGSRCLICLEDWDVNRTETVIRICCCRRVCQSCEDKIGTGACPLCRKPYEWSNEGQLARLRRHVENEMRFERAAAKGDEFAMALARLDARVC